jgi:hypothetical protein
MTVDYDAPRSTQPTDDGGLEVLTVRRGAGRSDVIDVDETPAVVESPDVDHVDDELTMPVIPMRGDEFRCARCFLVQHRHQLVERHGAQICRECA